MTTPIQTFDIALQDLTTNEMLVNALTQIAARIDGDISTANSMRTNGDAVIMAAMNLIAQRVTVLEEKPDELTEAERQVIEGFLDRLIKQEGFSSLISGLNIAIGGVSYSLKSVVESMLAARKIVVIDPSNYIDGIARTIVIQFAGGEALTINATETAKTAAELSEIFGRAVANGGIHLQYAGPFGDGTVGMLRIYESVPRAFAGVTVPELRMLRRTLLSLSLPGFAASTPVVLGGLDETGDGVIGVPPAPNLIAELLAALNTAIDAQALADAAVDAATASSLATIAAAADATPSAEALVASTQASFNDAQSAAGIAAAADAAAAADVAAAEQLLADATATGDQAQIDAASAALTQEQAGRALAAQALADAQAVQVAAAQVYTEAVQALNAITSTVSAAAQVQADAQAALASAQTQVTTAAAAVAQAQAAYDALVLPTPIP